jgi:phage terminase large subunit-like protein
VKKTDPWAAYAAGSEIDHFTEFAAEHLVQWVDDWDGQPLALEPFQRRMMGEALAYREDGWPVWESVVIVMPRKNGKTLLLAAYALYRLLTWEGSPEILLTASSDKQAGRLFEACANFVRKSPLLTGLCRVRDFAGEIHRQDGGGQILRMSSDPGRLHGYNPSLVVCDELAQWTTPSLRRAYAALTSGGGARKAPQVFTITTAGDAHDRHESILGHILDSSAQDGEVEREPGLDVCRLWPAKMLVYNHEAPTIDPRNTKAMKKANPASWITEEYLARQAADPELTDSEVLQLHGCVWAERINAWLPAGVWEPLFAEREVEDGEEIILGFDGSYRNDSTALVGCTLDGHLFVVGVWEKPNRKEDWLVPRGEVKATVAKAMERWQVLELACDPPGWHDEIEEWGQEYGDTVTLMYPTSRIKMMAAACSRFYTAVVNQDGISHDGNPRLAAHLANAVTAENADGVYITKDHTDSPKKIDLAVAAVIAFDRASQLTGEILSVDDLVGAGW